MNLERFEPGPSITIYSGKTANLLHLEDSGITITDIAHSLALQCRYTGHCMHFYSVAEHSLYVARAMGVAHMLLSEKLSGRPSDEIEKAGLNYTSREWELAGLCHDFGEALVGDMAQPVKSYFPEFTELEDYVVSQLSSMFTFPTDIPWVHHVDKAVAIVEMENIVNLPLEDYVIPAKKEVDEIALKSANWVMNSLASWAPGTSLREEVVRYYENLSSNRQEES